MRRRTSRDHPLRDLHPRVDFAGDPLVLLGLEIEKGEVLELALHARPCRAGGRSARRSRASRGRSRARLPSGRKPRVRMLWRRSASLTSTTRRSADHRQDHLAKGLGLLVLARDVGELADLRQAVDELGDLDPELLRDRFPGRQSVLEDVVEQADARSRRRRPSGPPGSRPRSAGGRGTARPSAGPGPCARGPRRRRPAGAGPGRCPGCMPRPSRGFPRSGSRPQG